MFSTKIRQRKSQQGFTLIEIMAVVLIIGLALGMGLRLDWRDLTVSVRNESKLFANTASLILEEAVLSGDLWGIDFYHLGNTQGYRWVHHQAGQWQVDSPVGMDDIKQHVELANGLSIEILIEEIIYEPPRLQQNELAHIDQKSFSPPVLFTPDHQSVPFTVTFISEEQQTITIESDLLGRFRVRE